MVISVGADHAGADLKKAMLPFLKELGYECIECGSKDANDVLFFPDIARELVAPVLDGRAFRAIMFCGTGVGASIACNKMPGIRAAMIHDIQCAHQAVEHDDVNVMCIGGKIVGEWLAKDLLVAFLNAKHDTDETARIVREKLDELDRQMGGEKR